MAENNKIVKHETETNLDNLSYKDVEKSLLEKKYLVNEFSKSALLLANSVIFSEIPEYRETMNNILRIIEEEKQELLKNKNKINREEFRLKMKNLENEKLKVHEKFKRFVLDYIKLINTDSADIKNSFYFIELFKKFEEENITSIKENTITINTSKKKQNNEGIDELERYI